MEFAKALGEPMKGRDGYQESDSHIVTWCVGHLVAMSYPEVYDPKYKRWSLDTLPFIPETYLYEVIPNVKKQFGIVSGLLNRKDVSCIYVCTDSGREGEYIYRLVAQEAKVKDKPQKRVWIESKTEEEIRRGIREAKDLSSYDHLSDAAYLRAKIDYLMGINFSRLLTLKYGNILSDCLGEKRCVISVGRVMTCVLGMIVKREREIRNFVKTSFYRVVAALAAGNGTLECEWRAAEGSAWENSSKLYKDNGFLKKEDALELIRILTQKGAETAVIEKIERKQEKKNPPLLYNLAELQNDCSRMFHISPDQTLNIAQELYEKKLITYPRTDARVLSSAVAKEIDRNLKGLLKFEKASPYAEHILENGSWKKIGKSRYTDDRQITDHYALIPTGSGLNALHSLNSVSYGVYMTILRRFLRIFYPPAVYRKISLTAQIAEERFFGNVRVLEEEGYLAVMPDKVNRDNSADPDDLNGAASLAEALQHLRKGSQVKVEGLSVKEGETSPPKRYNSGTIILAMENAGQLIEDEELRAQIKGSGIGTSATRAEILKKLVSNSYLALNKKTQILTPTLMGELIHDVVDSSIRPLLSPELTASWEKGLRFVEEGSVTTEEYMDKLKDFITRRTRAVMQLNNRQFLPQDYKALSVFYGSRGKPRGKTRGNADGKENSK